MRAASLYRIDGQLIIQNVQNLTTLAFPKLSQATVLVIDQLPKLSELGIDVQSATNIFIGRNQLLRNITLHVKEIHENLTITTIGNELKVVSLPDLVIIDQNFTIGCNPGLVDLVISSLKRIGNRMRIQGNAVMNHVRMPELQNVAGGIEMNGSFTLTA